MSDQADGTADMAGQVSDTHTPPARAQGVAEEKMTGGILVGGVAGEEPPPTNTAFQTVDRQLGKLASALDTAAEVLDGIFDQASAETPESLGRIAKGSSVRLRDVAGSVRAQSAEDLTRRARDVPARYPGYAVGLGAALGGLAPGLLAR